MIKNLKKIFLVVKSSVLALILLAITIYPVFLLGTQAKGLLGVAGKESSEKVQVETELLDVAFSDNDYDPSKDGVLNMFKTGVVTITFDDGWRSSYKEGLPILEEMGINATHYVLAGIFDNNLYMTDSQMKHLLAAGHEIGSHTIDHVKLINQNDYNLQRQVEGSKTSLEARLGTKIQHLASPNGDYDERVLNTVKMYYGTHRTIGGGPETLEPYDINVPFNRYAITGVTIDDSITLESFISLIEYTKANNGWLVLNYHSIGDQNSKYDIDPDTFKTQMQLVKDSAMATPTMGQVLAELEQ